MTNNWTEIHKDFSEKLNDKTYQQHWEERGLTYQDAKILFSVGFYPRNFLEVEKWLNCGFTSQEIKNWIDVGLKSWKNQDCEFAAYLRKKGHVPETVFQTKSHAQTWLDWKYSQEKRTDIKKLDIESEVLTGSLDLSDFVNLKVLSYSNNELTSLDLSNCSNLVKIICYQNYIINFSLPNNCSSLKTLKLNDWLGKSKFFQDLSFLKEAVNLEELDLSVKFHGSLKPLKNMRKLKLLNISNAEIDSGLEYLPDSITDFRCLAVEYWREGKKVLNIGWILRECGKLEESGKVYNLVALLKVWKEKNSKLVIDAWKKEAQIAEQQNTELKEELQMEREEFEKALQKAQEWRERQIKDITDQKDKEIEKLKRELKLLKNQQVDQQIEVRLK